MPPHPIPDFHLRTEPASVSTLLYQCISILHQRIRGLPNLILLLRTLFPAAVGRLVCSVSYLVKHPSAPAIFSHQQGVANFNSHYCACSLISRHHSIILLHLLHNAVVTTYRVTLSSRQLQPLNLTRRTQMAGCLPPVAHPFPII